jgi:arabinofuranosyltransferase
MTVSVQTPPAEGLREAWGVSSRVVLAAMCVAASLLYALYWNGIGPDDAWITYRYAENIAGGTGFVFNAGERVYGTSTPLYALILAAAGWIGLSVPWTSWVIGFAALNASIVLMYDLVRRIHGELSGFAAAGLLAGAYLVHRVATFGMETPLFLLLIIATFLAYVRDRQLLAAALAGLCLLMRLDGLAVGAALALGHMVTRREIPWKAGLVYAAVVAPWLIFAALYFGSPVPNTMVAKELHTFNTRLYWMPRWLLTEPRAWLTIAGGVVALSGARTRAAAIPLLLWTAMYTAAYSITPLHGYIWYKTPLFAGLAAFAGIAVVALAARLRAAPRAHFVVAAVLTTVVIMPDAARAGWRALGNEGIIGLERTRYEAALWMRDNLPPGASITTGGIGIVGYHTGRHIIDAMGLITPGSMRLEAELGDPASVPYPRFLQAVIEDHDPEFIFDGFGLAPGEDMPPPMRGRYTEVRRWEGDGTFTWKFILYRRNAVASVTEPR